MDIDETYNVKQVGQRIDPSEKNVPISRVLRSLDKKLPRRRVYEFLLDKHGETRGGRAYTSVYALNQYIKKFEKKRLKWGNLLSKVEFWHRHNVDLTLNMLETAAWGHKRTWKSLAQRENVYKPGSRHDPFLIPTAWLMDYCQREIARLDSVIIKLQLCRNYAAEGIKRGLL